MSITRVRDHIVKHHKYAWMLTAVSLVIVSGVYLHNKFADAATYTFTQSSTTGGWATVSTTDTAVHPGNGANWSKYYSASTTIVASASGVSLSPSSYTATDDGTFSTTTTAGSGTSLATGGTFASGTLTSTAITGSGVGASVGLLANTAKLLLHTDGTDTSTTFTDEMGKTVTANDNAQIDTAQSKFGGASGLFDGSYDRLRIPSTDFNIIDGTPMAIDLWIRLNVLPASAQDWVLMAQATYGADQAWYLLYTNEGGTRKLRFHLPPDPVITYDIDLSINTWYHIALTKDSSNTFRMFLNGALVGTPAVATGFPALGYIHIGGIGSASQHSFNGWLDEIRFSNGDARWTANFTPPTSAYLKYPYSGTFESATIDLGGKANLSTLVATSTQPSQTGTNSLFVQIATSNNSTGPWTYYNRDGSTTITPTSANAFSKDNTACTVTGTNPYTTTCSIPSALQTTINGNRYIRYKAYLATADTAYTPTLDSLTVNYTQYVTSGTLTSSKYDAGSSSNVIGAVSWVASGTDANNTVKFQVRSASSAAGLDSAPWCGQSDCSGSTYFTTSGTSNSTLSAATNDHQWFQYRVVLAGDSYTTPTLTSATVTYVQNAPPEAQNVTAVQNANGTVTVGYETRDIDSVTGSATPNAVNVTLQYCTTGTCTVSSDTGWTNAATVTGNVGAGVSVETGIGSGTPWSTGKTITWTPTTDYSEQYNATQKIRIKADDGEGANRYGYAVPTSGFILDTKKPTIGGGNATLNSSTAGATGGTITFTSTDDNTMQYRLCNNNLFPTTDTQLNSCAWSSAAATYASTTVTTHVLTGYPNNETVYLEVRDLYGNTTAKTLVAPATPGSFDFKDVSNTNIDVYREFLSWAVFTDITGSTFASYKVYSAHNLAGTTPVANDYSVLTTITNRAVNYYTHDITTATSSTYFYKVVAVDTDGDMSNETAVFSDIPNGTGGATEVPPVITDTPMADPSYTKNTSVRIIFTTDILATSEVQYRTSSGGSWQSAPETSYTKSHSVYLNNLYTSTSYDIKVKATSAASLASDWKTGTSFTTVSGPVITGVTPMDITDKNATIFWNTNASSTSKVYYGTGRSGSTLTGQVTVTGSDADTAGTNGLYQHQVGIPSSGSLTAGATYYYKVESTSKDGQSITTTDDNNGQFYSFATTLDTTAPVISSIEAAVIAPTSAVIVWTTNEPATSQVKYSGTSGNHSKRTETEMAYAGVPSYTVYHVATLSTQTNNVGDGGGKNTLSNETPYYYTVVSADAAGNSTESAEQTFTTTKTGETVVVTRRITETPAGGVPDTTAPIISNVKVADTTPFGATITFDTDEGAVGKVGYGKDTAYGDNASDDFSWATAHTIKLRGLTLGTEYHFTISAVDKAGNKGTSGDQTFKTSFLTENLKDLTKIENIEQYQKELEETIASILPSLIPPFVGKPQITDITENGATVSFKTNIKTFPVVGYAEDSVYDVTKDDPYTAEISDTTAKAVSHTLALINLKPNTKYHIQARAFSLPQVIGKSDDFSFTTKASKIQGSIVERKRDSFTVVWITDEPTSSIVEYKNIKSGITERKTDDTRTSSHSMRIENLPSATSYEVNISGVNAAGNIVEGGGALSVTTSKDVTPPVLSGFKVSNAMVPGRTDRIQTIISWETDEPADSTVYYEEGIGATTAVTAEPDKMPGRPGEEAKELMNKVESLDAYVVDHNLIVSSLKPGTIYRIKVTSRDDSGNLGSFGPRTIITPKQTESITDIIFKNFEDSFKFLRQM